MSKPASLIFLIVGDEEYGVHRMLVSLLASLKEAGVRCSVISIKDGKLAEALVRLGVNVQVLGSSQAPDYKSGFFSRPLSAASVLIHLLRNVAALSAAVKAHAADAMIVRMPNLVPLAAIAGRLCRIRTAWIMPNAVSQTYPMHVNKIVYEILVKAADLQIIANSAYTASTLFNWFRNPDVLWLGVDKNLFARSNQREEIRAALKLDDGDRVIGVFARLVPDKGQEALIRALPGVLTAYPRTRLLLVGSTPEVEYIAYLKALSSSLNVAHAVIFLGSQSDVRPYYEACDITANVRVTPEPFGLSIVESMMLGVPVLAHAAGAPGETVKDGLTGWLYHDPSPRGIQSALLRALGESDRWPEMGVRAASSARELFDVGIVARRLVIDLLRLPAHA